MKETIKWFGKTILNIASIIIFIISLCSMDSEALWLPVIGALASTAWIIYNLYALEKDGEHDVQN